MDNLGINKSVWELHSPEDHTKLISSRFSISPIIKSIIKATKEGYGKSHQEILEASEHYIKIEPSLNTGLDPNLQKIGLGSDAGIHSATQGNLTLCLRSSPLSRVFHMCSSLMDLKRSPEKLKYFLSSRPPQGGPIQSIPSTQHYCK